MPGIVEIVLVIFLLAAIALLMRLRVRLKITFEEQTLFVGLGYTGFSYDFTKQVRSIHVSGVRVRRRPYKLNFPTLQRFIALLPRVLKVLAKYFRSIVRGLVIEELDGQIIGGFSQPHLTGMTYGFYQAVLAGMPVAAGRFQYVPDWQGASFRGNFKICLAIPLHRLIFRTTIMIFQMPLIELIKLAIGRKARLERSRKDRKSNDTAK